MVSIYLKTLQNNFQSGHTILCSFQQWTRVSVDPHSWPHLVLPVFWILAIPIGVFSSVQPLIPVRLFATLRITAHQASLSITNSRSSLRLTSIESVMPSSHIILCCPLLLLPPIPPCIRVFSNESTLPMRWPKYWSFSFSIIPSKEIPGLIWSASQWTGWISLQSKGLSRVLVD